MAAYAQFSACEYPTTNHQLLCGSNLSPRTALTPLGLVTTPSSPASGGLESRVGSALTPDAVSQTSTSGTSSSIADGLQSTSSSVFNSNFFGTPVSSSTSTRTCCDNGQTILTDPLSGHSGTSCQYDPASCLALNYTRLQSVSNAAAGAYGTAYRAANEPNLYPSIGVECTAFYSNLNNPYTIKDSSTSTDASWTPTGLQPSPGFYTYDPHFGAYGYGTGYDLAARRKNATRESTATLKAWLTEHKKNPYPTKGEKIMLAIITKMTLTQVSTWFANARRRLKKENKMTWEPKNRPEDDEDAMTASDDERKDRMEDNSEGLTTTNGLLAENRQGLGANITLGGNGAVSGATNPAEPTRVACVGGAGSVAVVASHGVGIHSAQAKGNVQFLQTYQPPTMSPSQQPIQYSQTHCYKKSKRRHNPNNEQCSTNHRPGEESFNAQQIQAHLYRHGRMHQHP